MKNVCLRFICFVFIVTVASCKKELINSIGAEEVSNAQSDKYPEKAVEQDPVVLFTNPAGYKVYNGGYGSSMAVVPASDARNTTSFYYMTDRGPNVGRPSGGNYFPLPDFNPQIGIFKLAGDKLIKTGVINFKAKNGELITGIPNPAGQNPTGEIPYDASGNVLPFDANGLDPEGLAVAKDGSFWVSDEYGPHIVHFDRFGNTIERISPFQNGTNNREIPKVFINRRPNRGMEGLAITANGKYLLGAMQSPLDNPALPTTDRDKARNSRANRLLLFDIATGKTKQFVYRTEIAGNYISEIIALNNTDFMVLERDSNFPLRDNPSSSFKRVYRISIKGATDVSDADNSSAGKLFNGKTLEVAAYDNDAAFAAIKPVSKSLVVDIIDKVPTYPHDKAEGIALINNHLLAVCNDDDFGVIDDGTGNYIAKYLPFYSPDNVIDFGETYFINIK